MATPTTFAPVVTNPGGTGTTITPILPSGHAAGDVIEIWVGVTGVTAWSAPAGWTIKQATSSSGNASTGVRGTILYRRVLPGDSLPLANPTCTLGATVTRAAIAFCKRGLDVEGVHTLPEWQAFTTTAGTANPVRPLTTTTLSPENLVTHYYISRSATNAPEPSGYTETQQVVISGTMVINVSQKNVADQQTALTNQDASPTSGARWVGMISCTPSPDYSYYRSGSSAFQANATSATPALPTGTSSSDNRGNKDLIVATVECAGTPTIAPNTPADWTEITEWASTTSGNGTTVRKYRAFYDGSLDRQFNRSTSGEIFVYFSTYRNAHQSFPLSGAAVQQNASSTSGTWPAMARTSTKATIQLTCVADATPTYTTPSPWTERNDSQGVVCADQSFNAAGTVSSGAFTLNSANPTLCGLLEVNSVASQIVVSVVPATASLSLATFAPTVTTTNNITVVPSTALLVLGGSALFTDCVAAWKLSDLTDSTGRGNTLTNNNAVSFANPGVIGDSASFVAASSQYLSKSSSPDVELGDIDWTIAFWARATDTGGYMLVTKDTDTGRDFLIDRGANTWSAFVFVGGSAIQVSTDIGSFVADTFYCVIAWHDSVANTINISVNDNTPGSTATGGPLNTPGNAQFRIGARQYPSLEGYLNGRIDNVNIWKRVLTLDERTQFYNSGNGVEFSGGTFPPTIVISATTIIIPATQTLSLTAFVPVLTQQVIPTTASLVLTGFAPVIDVSSGVTVTPDTVSLTLTPFGSSLRTSVAPTPEPLALTTFAVQLAESTTPANANLTLTTFAPSVVANVTVEPSAALLATTAFVPSLRESVVPSNASLSLNTFAPLVSVNVVVEPQAASLALTAFDLSLNVAVTPVTAPLTTITFAPILNLTPPTTNLILSTFAPLVTIGDSVIVEPPIASLTITTFAPSIVAPVMVTPDVIQLTLTVFGPSLHLVVNPQTRALNLTTFSPSLTETITPGTANLSIASVAPSLALSIQSITSTLALATFAPTVTSGAGADVIVIPATATLTLITFAPLARRGVTPPSRSFMINLPRREYLVPRGNRVFVVSKPDREEVIQ